MSGRQDNLSSVFAGLHALTSITGSGGEELLDRDAWAGGRIPVLALFDHEEIGSGTPTGARGPLLEEVMRRICLATGIYGDGRDQTRANSVLLSADAAHSVNPGYEDKHGPKGRPVMGGGPVLKVDADQLRHLTGGRGNMAQGVPQRRRTKPGLCFTQLNASGINRRPPAGHPVGDPDCRRWHPNTRNALNAGNMPRPRPRLPGAGHRGILGGMTPCVLTFGCGRRASSSRVH